MFCILSKVSMDAFESSPFRKSVHKVSFQTRTHHTYLKRPEVPGQFMDIRRGNCKLELSHGTGLMGDRLHQSRWFWSWSFSRTIRSQASCPSEWFCWYASTLIPVRFGSLCKWSFSASMCPNSARSHCPNYTLAVHSNWSVRSTGHYHTSKCTLYEFGCRVQDKIYPPCKTLGLMRTKFLLACWWFTVRAFVWPCTCIQFLYHFLL